MSDIHHGFQDVDQTATEPFFQFLDAVAGVASVQAYRQRMVELCPPTSGQRVLDVGCGIGHSTLQLAPLVGAEGAVVGIDKSARLIGEAQRRAHERGLPVTYQVGDAQQLEFPDHSFDLCRTERVLMYLADPQAALDEMVRVVRPGGMVLCYEFDYDGIIVDAPDQCLTRQLLRYVTDSVPSPWIGRQLPRLLRERGLQAITVIPHMIVTPYPLFQQVVSGTLDQAVQADIFSAATLASWWGSLEEVAATGHFFAGFPGFLVSGQNT